MDSSRAMPRTSRARFFHLLDATEREARAAQRRLMRHALPLVLLSLALDVEAELRVELVLDGVAREERAQTIANVAQESGEHVRTCAAQAPRPTSGAPNPVFPPRAVSVPRA